LWHLDVLRWVFTQVLLFLREFGDGADVVETLPHDRLGIALVRQPVQLDLNLEGVQFGKLNISERRDEVMIELIGIHFFCKRDSNCLVASGCTAVERTNGTSECHLKSRVL
jgi:hypothetical protein